MSSPIGMTPHIAPAAPTPLPPDVAAPPVAVSPTPSATAAQPRQPPLSAQVVAEVAQQINDFLRSNSASLEFQVDSQSGEVLVRVVDSDTNEVIRQIPSEQIIAIAHAIDQMYGLLFKQKA